MWRDDDSPQAECSFDMPVNYSVDNNYTSQEKSNERMRQMRL